MSEDKIWRIATHTCGKEVKLTQRFIDKGVPLFCLCDNSLKSWKGWELDEIKEPHQVTWEFHFEFDKFLENNRKEVRGLFALNKDLI